MGHCKCGSYAINPHNHGRQKGVDLDLCDVCYWRKRAEHLRSTLTDALNWYERQAQVAGDFEMVGRMKESLGI